MAGRDVRARVRGGGAGVSDLMAFVVFGALVCALLYVVAFSGVLS